MSDILIDLLDKAKELLKNKPQKSQFNDVDYIINKLHIGKIKAELIIELLQEEDK